MSIIPLTGSPTSSIFQVIRYLLIRLVVILLTLIVGVYFAIIVANLGGYIDEIIKDRINDSILASLRGGWLKEVQDIDLRNQIIEDRFLEMERAAGIYDPFLLRCLRWEYEYITFQWHDTRINKALPNTIFLFGTASLLLFFASMFLSLFLARNYGSWLDRLVVALSPISSIPSWAIGLLLVMVFAIQFHLLPPATTITSFTRMIADLGNEISFHRILEMLKQMILPVSAIFLSVFFQLTYSWRTFFLIYAGEDYVDVAKAKGLPTQRIEQQYILRPSLPYVITYFTFVLISYWQTSMVLESFFKWPGIGTLYVKSVGLSSLQPAIVMNIVTIFAFLLAVSVFILDIVYAIVDPRLRLARQDLSLGRQPRRERWKGFVRWLKMFRQSAETQHSFGKIASGKIASGKIAEGNFAADSSQDKSESLLMTTRLVGISHTVESSQRIGKLPRSSTLRRFKLAAREVLRSAILPHPSALIGLTIIFILLVVSITTLIVMPYQDVVRQWSSNTWSRNPAYAMPVWVNYFRAEKLPESINLDSRQGAGTKTVTPINDEMTSVLLTLTFDYAYDTYPSDVAFFFYSTYEQKRPFIALTWVTPDGREIDLGTVTTTSETRVYASQEARYQRKLGSDLVHRALFADPKVEEYAILKGTYQLVVNGVTFEDQADIDAEILIFGRVHGLAGTDHLRRDLSLALLWGAPVALGLGLFGAVLTSLTSVFFAAVGVWFGGWVDTLIQSITEVNIMLPVLPIGVMAFFLYRKDVWFIIGAIILFSVFSTSTKNYRAAFLQVKELPYLEAARAYGAGNWRVIFRYLIPRILPVMVPQLVATVPGFIFLEATLAILRVGDPRIPTWGAVVYEALVNGTFSLHYYWVLEPIVLLVITGLAFVLVGYALDRVFNPRLRSL